MPRASRSKLDQERARLSIGTETWIQTKVAVGSVKARVVEEVEKLRVETKFISLGQVEFFEESKVETRLECSAKCISRSGSKSRFGEIARSGR